MKLTSILLLTLLGLLVLHRINYVRNAVSGLLLDKTYKQYEFLSGNETQSGSFRIKKLIDGALSPISQKSPIVFDMLTENFLVKSNEQESLEHTLWKINNKGEIVDSLNSIGQLFASGVYFYDTIFVDWVITGNKSEQKYDAIINYDGLSEGEFQNYLNLADMIDFSIYYENSEDYKGRCFLKIQRGWIVIESKNMFDQLEQNFEKDYFQMIHKDFPNLKTERLIPLKNSITLFYEWTDKKNILFIQKIKKEFYQSGSFYDMNNTSRSGWDGTGYFGLNYKSEHLYFKSYTFQNTSFLGYVSDGSPDPDVSIYLPEKKYNINLVFIELEKVRGLARDEADIGLYVLKEKEEK